MAEFVAWVESTAISKDRPRATPTHPRRSTTRSLTSASRCARSLLDRQRFQIEHHRAIIFLPWRRNERDVRDDYVLRTAEIGELNCIGRVVWVGPQGRLIR